MFIILKGLIDKKKILKYSLIIFITLLTITIFASILEYQKNLINKEYNKEEYRKIIITLKENNMDFLNSFTIEDVNRIDDLQYEIIFYTKDTKDDFIKSVKSIRNITTIETKSIPQSFETNTIAFKIMITFLSVSIILLILVFSINYIYLIEKDLSLYKLLGFNKKRIVCLLLLFLTMVSTLLYLLANVLTFIGYRILNKIDILTNFNYTFKIEIKNIFLIMSIYLVAFLINSIILKNKNDFQIINTNWYSFLIEPQVKSKIKKSKKASFFMIIHFKNETFLVTGLLIYEFINFDFH